MFLCNKCGLCCQHVDESSLYAELDRGDGVCRYFEENLCSIYENRPLLCCIDKSYEVFFKDKMSKEEFYSLNYLGCENLKLKYGKKHNS